VQPLDSFSAFYGTRRFITALTRALQLYLSSARPIQSTTLNPINKCPTRNDGWTISWNYFNQTTSYYIQHTSYVTISQIIHVQINKIIRRPVLTAISLLPSPVLEERPLRSASCQGSSSTGAANGGLNTVKMPVCGFTDHTVPPMASDESFIKP
jgi:hypothetical protein